MMTSIQVFPDCALPAEQPGGQDGQSRKYETHPKHKWRFITGKIIHYTIFLDLTYMDSLGNVWRMIPQSSKAVILTLSFLIYKWDNPLRW